MRQLHWLSLFAFAVLDHRGGGATGIASGATGCACSVRAGHTHDA
jgi:hypothetical protein